MKVAEWPDTYGIQRGKIYWSNNRKLAWMGLEPTTTEFRSDPITGWAIWPSLQLTLCAATPVSVENLIWAIAFFSRHVYFNQNFGGNHMNVAEWPDTFGIHHWRILWSSYRKADVT